MRTSEGKEDWVESPLKAIDIAVGATGAVWAINSDHHVVRLNNGAWEPTGGSGVRISVDPSGNPWVVTDSGQVSQWTGSSWRQIPASANDISIAPDGAVFILGSMRVRGGFEVLRLRGSTWEHIVGEGGIAISAGAKAVYLAQDTTTNLVVSSENGRLRIGNAEVAAQPSETASVANLDASPSMNSSPTPNTSSPAPAVATEASSQSAPATANQSDGDKSGSIPHPSAGAVVGVLGGLGGLLSKAVSVAPVPNPGAVQGAVVAATAGAVAGAAGNLAGAALSNAASGVASGPPAMTASQASPLSPETRPAKAALPSEPAVPGVRPAFKVPIPGSLKCPIIGSGAILEKACDIGRDALKLAMAPSTDCAAPSFADSRNGGECWTCPANFVRGTTPVDANDACVGPAMEHSVATLVKGCATYKAPPGYGTPFRDSPNGSECYVCPLPLQRSWSSIAKLSKGNLAACLGKGRDLIVWQLGQFPEVGVYRFMPGLISIALANPKAVDAFLIERAGGDTAISRELWAKMIADPSGSPELKALVFASLLKVANDDSASAVAKDALHEFESYMRTRRVYVADEALRMYKKAREVDASVRSVTKDADGIKGIAGDAVQSAANDFKTYAWSAVMPDSAGTEFILASAALSRLAASGGAQDAVDPGIASLNVRYLAPVTLALESELNLLQGAKAQVSKTAGSVSSVVASAKSLKGADPALIATTLLSGAMNVSKGFTTLFNKDKLASEYEKYVEEMKAPLRVRDMLESTKVEDRQTLLLYWALATSPHKASEKLGEGALSGAELCSSDSWTESACSSAKTIVQAAAKAAGYAN
jgi:hypothetical protein